MITPAVLISACGTLIMSTSQRLGRVIERVRSWSNQLNTITTPAASDPARDVAMIFAQLEDTARRARYLQWALTAYYLAVGVFVADMMVIGLMALTSHSEVWPTVGLGLLGAACSSSAAWCSSPNRGWR